MTVWVLHQTLTPQEEARIRQRTHLTLPFDGLPDLTDIHNPAQARQLLRALYPGDPPEAISLRFDRFWKQYDGLHKEDIIAVPLPGIQQVALAEVTGHYQYQVGEGGSDIHTIPVTWYEEEVPMARFSKHKEIFLPRGIPMFEVSSSEARIVIRDQLPHSYNRFARWKWLLALFFAMGMLRMVLRFSQ